MPLSWNEIRARVVKLPDEWEGVYYENGRHKPFIMSFFKYLETAERI